MSGADGLAEWYAARLDEAEAMARAATPGPWQVEGAALAGYPFGALVIDTTDGDVIVIGETGRADLAFIAAHDPAWRLRDIAAKRAVLAAHPRTETMFAECGTCHESEEGWAATVPVQWPCPTVRHLAAEFADQPGYRPEWRPET